MSAIDESHLLAEVSRVLQSVGDRREKAASVAKVVRRARDYRWVGIYEVTGEEIAVIGWNGLGEPAYPRFPITQGLSGTVVSSGETVVVGDVTADPRYLTAFGSTRFEVSGG